MYCPNGQREPGRTCEERLGVLHEEIVLDRGDSSHPGANVAASVTDIGSGVEVRAVTDAGLPSHGPKRALARPGVRSSVGGTSRGGHS